MKRIYSLAIITIILCSIFNLCVSANNIDPSQANELEILKGLNIIPNYNEEAPEGFVTKAEFAKNIFYILCLGDVSNTDDNIFTDVDKTLSEASYINTLARMNIFTISKEKLFYPKSNVTIEFALETIVNVLGYASKAEYIGYNKVVNDLKLLNKLSNNGRYLTQRNETILLYNTLHTDVSVQVTFSNKSNFKVEKGENLLKIKHNIIFSKGVVNANQFTKLHTPVSKLNSDEIEIDGVKYKVSDNIDTSELLGYKVGFYYKLYDDNDNTILFAYKKNNGEIINLNSEKFIHYKDGEIEYYSSEDLSKTSKLTMDNKTDVIYNNKSTGNYDHSNINLSYGNMVLIDNDGDGTFEVLKINAIKTFVVDYTDTNKFIIASKISDCVINADETNGYVEILKNNLQMDFIDIREWDLLEVMQSQNNTGEKYTSIKIIDNKIYGELTEKSDDYIVIGAMKFEIANDAKNIFKSQNIKVGMIADFYLNSEKQVVFFNDFLNTNNVNLAYLVFISQENDIDNTVILKIMKDSGKKELLKCSNKIILNGENQNSSVLLKKEYFGDENSINRTMFTYQTNSKNEIVKIELLEHSTKDILYYRSNGKSFSNRYRITDDAKVFLVREGGIIDDTKDITMSSINYFGDRCYYRVEFYNLSESNVSNLVVVYPDEIVPKWVEYYTSVMLVDGVSIVLNNQGEVVQKIYGCYQGQQQASLNTQSDTVIMRKLNLLTGGYDIVDNYKIQRGDILQFGRNTSGEITAINVIYSCMENYNPDNEFAYAYNTYGGSPSIGGILVDSELLFMNANVEKFEKQKDILLSINDVKLAFAISGNVKVYICDTISNKMRLGSLSDIVQNEKILIRSYWGNIEEIMIVR